MSATMDSVYTFFLLRPGVVIDYEVILQRTRELFEGHQVYIELFQVTKGEISYWESYAPRLFGDRKVKPLPESVSGTLVVVFSQDRYASRRDIRYIDRQTCYYQNHMAYDCLRLKCELEEM